MDVQANASTPGAGPATAHIRHLDGVSRETQDRLLAVFRCAATTVAAYRTILAEQNIVADEVTDLASFTRLCPVLSKSNTFERFPIALLSTPGRVSDLADVLTSSGRGGRFSFGVSTRAQVSATVGFLDDAFDDAFAVKSRTTLAINCLPMGVGFSSNVMTVATTSVREDMAIALVEAFGADYDQLLLVGDPLFLKRLTDQAGAMGVDWGRHRVNAIVGEEIFGERFRSYLSQCLGADVNRSDRGYIMSSFGVGELGLHIGYETRATIALRQRALEDPAFARDLFGITPESASPLPMLFAFNPLRSFIEILDSDHLGYGAMTTSMLDVERKIPLLRYQTGDVSALVTPDRVAELVTQHGITLPGPIPGALFALKGRNTEEMPNGSHVGTYKDALYVHPHAAESLTGAVRLVFADGGGTMHVQLARTASASAALRHDILSGLPPGIDPPRLVLWPYGDFPFGMTLDYERKFAYYVPGEGEPPVRYPDPR